MGHIIKVGKVLEKKGVAFAGSFGKKVWDGSLTSFWLDKWVGNFQLSEKYPRLFHLESNKSVLVSERGEWEEDGWNWVWSWNRELRGRVMNEYEELKGYCNNNIPKIHSRDKVWWFNDEEGKFSVKALKEMVDENDLNPHASGLVTKWNNRVPIKVNIFI